MDKLVEKALSSEETDACQQLYNIIKNFVTKKGQLGKKAPTNPCANALLSFLLNDDHPGKTRRWAGVLLEAIVTKIPALRQYILGLANLLPFLGGLVTRGDEDLKLVTATLIRALVGSDSQSLSLFWPAEELGSSQIRRFPLTDQSSRKQWIEDLTSFMDDAFSRNKAVDSQSRLQVNFIQAVSIQAIDSTEDLHIMPEDRSIYMILQGGITVTTVPIASSDPFFLDIPFDKISDVKVQTDVLVAFQEPSASESLVQLHLNMKTGLWNHQLYAREAEAKAILFTFGSLGQAKQVAMFIEQEFPQTRNSGPKMSMSQPLNISQEVKTDSPRNPLETAPEAASPQAMETGDGEPAHPEALPRASPGRRTQRSKSTRLTTRDSNASRRSADATPPRTRARSSDTNNAGGSIEPERQPDGQGVVDDPKGKLRPSAGNLSSLLSAALSPEPDEPIFRSVRRKGQKVQSVATKTAQKTTNAPKKKATPIAKGRKSKQRQPVATVAKGKSKVPKKPSSALSDQSDQLAEDPDIWDIPDNPADLKTAASKNKKAKVETTAAKRPGRKAPAQPIKPSVSKKRAQVIESDVDSDNEPDGDKNDSTFKIASAPLAPSSSPRRSVRLQTSAVKQKPIPTKGPKSRASNLRFRKLEIPSSPTRHFTRVQTTDAKPKGSTAGQTSKPTEAKKGPGTNPQKHSVNKGEPEQAPKPKVHGKKQVPITSHTEDKACTPIPIPANGASVEETIEAFEEAVVDFQSEPDLRNDQVQIKKEPGLKSKTLEPARVGGEGATEKRPISIASDAESDDDSEDVAAAEGIHKAVQAPEKATTTAKDTQDIGKDVSKADPKAAYDDVSIVEDSYPLAKRDTTPQTTLGPTLVDNRPARKMAMISFDQSGTRNQGSRLCPRSADGTPTIRSGPIQPRGVSQKFEKVQAMESVGFQTHPTIILPSLGQGKAVGYPRIDKRVAPDDFPERRATKRQRTSQSIARDDGFVDIEFYSEAAGWVSRRASQRSVHITDDGSPIRGDTSDEQAAAMPTDLGGIEDRSTEQRSNDEAARPMTRDVPPFQIPAQKTRGHATPSIPYQNQHRISKPTRLIESHGSINRKPSQRPTKLNRNQVVEDSDGEEFAEAGLLSTLRSSQARTSPGGSQKGSIPASRRVSNHSDQDTFEVIRHRSSSGRTQRSTAPMSSNHKPLPQPPGLDSQVFSAYAPEQAVQEAVARNRAEEIANDPFSSSQKDDGTGKSMFMRRLAILMEHRHSNTELGGAAEDADKTLVEDTPMEDAESLSSSDEELAVVVEEPEEEETDNVEEMEWEAALQPRHRDMFEVLGRITRRLVSHLIDSETAVDDVVDDYGRDGTRLVEEVERCYRGQQSKAGGFQASMAKLRKLYGDAERQTAQCQTELQLDVDSAFQNWNAGLQGRKNAVGEIKRLVSA